MQLSHANNLIKIIRHQYNISASHNITPVQFIYLVKIISNQCKVVYLVRIIPHHTTPVQVMQIKCTRSNYIPVSNQCKVLYLVRLIPQVMQIKCTRSKYSHQHKSGQSNIKLNQHKLCISDNTTPVQVMQMNITPA